jgi:glycosyltransferase involved in cell wall biosynthesis
MGVDYPFRVRFVDGLEEYALGRGSMTEPSKQIYNLLQGVEYDILQVCNFMPMLLVTMMRSLLEPPVAFSFYNTPNLPKRAIGYYDVSRLDTNLASFILQGQGYDALVVGSRNYYDSAVSLGAHRHLARLSFLGVDVNELQSEKRESSLVLYEYLGPNLNQTDTLIMLPSRITKQKGIIEAVNALAIVNKSQRVKLLLTGMSNPFDKKYAAEVMQVAHNLNVEDYIIKPLKQIPRGAMAHFYRRANAVVVPSYYEGLGLSAIEALTFERPLIAASVPGLNEVAIDSHNALTFESGNHTMMAKAILRLLSDVQLQKVLISNAKASVQKFGLETHVDELENVYRELIALKGASRPNKESVYV